MKIMTIISGITNMRDKHICVSANDMQSGVFVRPLLTTSRLTVDFLTRPGGCLRVGSQVEFEVLSGLHKPIAPHCEDIWINPDNIKILAHMDYPRFKEFVAGIADHDVCAIYGPGLELLDGQPVVPPDCGKRSLGAIICRECTVYIDHTGKTRCDVIDKTGCLYRKIPVVARDECFRREGVYRDIALRMGLSRPYRKSEHDEEYCWVHVSGVYA